MKSRNVKKEDFAYCGLNCTTCKNKFADIRKKIIELEKAFDEANVEEIVKVIPFMKLKYLGYKKFINFFKNKCPGCRKGGGNPFCSIRKCAKKKGYFSCAECKSDMCKKFKLILKVHKDNEVQNNRKIIKSLSKNNS